MHSPETPMREPDQDTSNSSSAPAAQQQQFCNNKQTNKQVNIGNKVRDITRCQRGLRFLCSQ